MKTMGMSAAAAKRSPHAAKPESTRSPGQLKGLEKARAARKAKREERTNEAEEVIKTATKPMASAVESLIELFAERWNKIGLQADADRLQAEIEQAAMTLAPEDLLAYAAAPSLRGRLLSLCVLARAHERAAAPRGIGAELEGRADHLGDRGLVSSRRTGRA